MRTTPLKIFIGFREDNGTKAAKDLRSSLEAWGLKVFMAQRDVKTGDVPLEVIRKNLDSTDAFIALATPGYDERPWCQQELGWAECKRIPVCWVTLPQGPRPKGFQEGRKPLEVETEQDYHENVLEWLGSHSPLKPKLCRSVLDALKNDLSFSEIEKRAIFLARLSPTPAWVRQEALDLAEANNKIGKTHVNNTGRFRPGFKGVPTFPEFIEHNLETSGGQWKVFV